MRITECTQFVLTWAARATAVAMFTAIGLFAMGQGLPSPRTMSVPVLLEFIALSFIMGGYAAGLRHPALGGLVILGAVGFFNLVELAVNGSIAGGIVNWLALPGVLFIVAAVMKRRARGREHAHESKVHLESRQ